MAKEAHTIGVDAETLELVKQYREAVGPDEWGRKTTLAQVVGRAVKESYLRFISARQIDSETRPSQSHGA